MQNPALQDLYIKMNGMIPLRKFNSMEAISVELPLFGRKTEQAWQIENQRSTKSNSKK